VSLGNVSSDGVNNRLTIDEYSQNQSFLLEVILKQSAKIDMR